MVFFDVPSKDTAALMAAPTLWYCCSGRPHRRWQCWGGRYYIYEVTEDARGMFLPAPHHGLCLVPVGTPSEWKNPYALSGKKYKIIEEDKLCVGSNPFSSPEAMTAARKMLTNNGDPSSSCKTEA